MALYTPGHRLAIQAVRNPRALQAESEGRGDADGPSLAERRACLGPWTLGAGCDQSLERHRAVLLATPVLIYLRHALQRCRDAEHGRRSASCPVNMMRIKPRLIAVEGALLLALGCGTSAPPSGTETEAANSSELTAASRQQFAGAWFPCEDRATGRRRRAAGSADRRPARLHHVRRCRAHGSDDHEAGSSTVLGERADARGSAGPDWHLHFVLRPVQRQRRRRICGPPSQGKSRPARSRFGLQALLHIWREHVDAPASAAGRRFENVPHPGNGFRTCPSRS